MEKQQLSLVKKKTKMGSEHLQTNFRLLQQRHMFMHKGGFLQLHSNTISKKQLSDFFLHYNKFK